MRNKKIAFFIVGLGMGGAEHLVVKLANFFSKKNKVTLIILTNDLTLSSRLNSNVELIKFDLGKSKFSVIKCLNFLKNNNFDIVHSHMYHANLLARLAKLMGMKAKVISSIHNSVESNDFFKSKLINLLYRISDQFSYITTNVSNRATETMILNKVAPKSKIVTLYNGVDFNCFSNEYNTVFDFSSFFSSSGFNLISVASLTEQKGHFVAIKAIKEVLELGFHCNYLIVGDGPLKDELKSLVTDLSMNDNIKFYGLSSDVSTLLKGSDLFLLPSLWEGFGLVILEAVSCSKNIITTDCDGPIEILGSNYLNLCNKGDVKSLRDKIVNCIKDNSIKYDVDNIKERFSFESMIFEVECIYKKSMI